MIPCGSVGLKAGAAQVNENLALDKISCADGVEEKHSKSGELGPLSAPFDQVQNISESLCLLPLRCKKGIIFKGTKGLKGYIRPKGDPLLPYGTLRAGDIEGSDVEPTTLRADDFEGRRL